MPRHYRPMTRAEKDARIDAKVARMEAAGIPLRDGPAPREPARVELHMDGQSFVAIGRPARRINQFAWTLNGEPIGVSGAEDVWRLIQRKRVPMLAARNFH